LRGRLLINGAKKSWEKPEPAIIMADRAPTCTAPPPASTSIAGMIVSISVKFWAKARKTACQRNAAKFRLEIFSESVIL